MSVGDGMTKIYDRDGREGGDCGLNVFRMTSLPPSWMEAL